MYACYMICLLFLGPLLPIIYYTSQLGTVQLNFLDAFISMPMTAAVGLNVTLTTCVQGNSLLLLKVFSLTGPLILSSGILLACLYRI